MRASMGKIVPVPSTARFLEILKSSRLLSPEAFAKVEEQAKDVADPAVLARNLVRDNVLTKWQANQILHGFHALVIGKYKLLDQVGINETGRVYLAEHGQLGRKVALKLLAKRYMSNPEIVQRFLTEARMAAAIDHRNILHVHDVAHESDRTFLVTEYVAGPNLNEIVKAGPVTLERILAIVQQLVNGVKTAHENGVVHGGLRPSTVVVDAQGTVKILDLGVASLADLKGTQQEESVELSIDALAYAAPERTESQVAATGDVYAIGAILFFLLTGESPKLSWKARDGEQAASTTNDIFAYLKSKSPQAPQPLLKLSALCMSPQAKDRPQTAAEISKALELIAAGGKKGQSQALVEQIEIAIEPVVEADVAPATTTKPTAKPVVALSKASPLPAKPSLPAAKPLTQAKPVKALPKAPTVTPTSTARVAATKTVPAPRKAGPAASPVKATPSAGKIGPVVADSDDDEKIDEKDSPTISVNLKSEFAGLDTPSSSKAPPTKKKAASKAAPAPVVEEEEVDDEQDEADAVEPAKSRLPLIIGISVGGVVLALAGIVGAFMFMGGGGSKPTTTVAENKTPETEAMPETEPMTEPEPEPDPAAMDKPAKKSILDDAPTEPTPPPAEPMPTTPTDSATPPTPAPTETPATTPPEGTPATPTPTPTESPKPTTEPAPEPMPAKKKFEDPFRDFPKVITLPSLGTPRNVPPEALQEKVISKMYLMGAECFVELHGGETAAKGKKEFSIKLANETSTNEYDIRLQSGAESATAPIIAKLFLGDEFKFQWQPAAAEQVDAPYLMNCLLSLQAGKYSRDIPLRDVQAGEPLQVNAPPKPVAGKWNIEALPEPASLRIEFLDVEGVGTHKYDKKEFIGLNDSGTVWLGKMAPTIGVRLAATITRTLEVKAQFFLKPDPEDKEMPLKGTKMIETTLQNAMGYAQNLEIQLNNATKAAAKQAQKKPDPTQQNMEAERTKVQKYITNWQGVGESIEALKNPATIHFRLMFETKSGKRVEIMSTNPGAVPKDPNAAKPKPKPKL